VARSPRSGKRSPESAGKRREFLESTGFPALLKDAYRRWRDHLSPDGQRQARELMAETLNTSTRTISNWMDGVTTPNAYQALRTVLAAAPANAEHLPALDAAFARARNGLDPAAVERARDILRDTRAPAGATWVSHDGGPATIDTSPAATDMEAAAQPAVAERHENLKARLRTLLRTLGDRLANYRGWEDLRPSIEALDRIVDCPTTDLPGRMVSLYDAMVSVASFIDQDNAIAGDAASLFEKLPPDIRRALGDVVATGAPWVRVFPTARATDEEAGSFLTRTELFEPMQAFLDLSLREKLIAQSAVDRIVAELKVADRGGFQAQKAGNRAFGTVRNLIGFAGGIVFTVFLGAVGSQVQQGSQLAQSAGQVFVQGEATIRRLIEGLPADYRAAVDIAMQASRPRLDDVPPAPPAILPERPRQPVWPPRTPLTRWRDRIPGLPEDACPEMITLPAGRFMMGAPKGEEGSDDNERPRREVTVPVFALGRCAVTFAQWDAARQAGAKLPHPADRDWGRGDRPVINVSWHDAQAYCAWLNDRLGLRTGGYRLPSEAEWEYACRAGTQSPFSFGATISTDQANYDGNYTYGRGRKGTYRNQTVPVGSLPANDWGLHEMHGNVLEWCEDGYGTYPANLTGACPLHKDNEKRRVLRGGSWSYFPGVLRSARRLRDAPENRDDVVGFRVARTPGSLAGLTF
jgi:formylglycine-generating enzyme required for sulfatase activity